VSVLKSPQHRSAPLSKLEIAEIVRRGILKV
jgi:hypothetical protein